MPRRRAPLKKIFEGNLFVVKFRHPCFDLRMVRLVLGVDQSASEGKLGFLNQIFLNPQHWNHPPANFPKDVWELWQGKRGGVSPKNKEDGDDRGAQAHNAAAYWKDEYLKLADENKALRVELAHWRGKRTRVGPCPTLGDACAEWKKTYVNRDPDHIKIVGYDLDRFVEKFGADTEVDWFAGEERQIGNWLRSLSVGAGRRKQIRQHVLRFLEDVKCPVDRREVPSVKKAEVRKDRGPIRWIERDQAEALSRALDFKPPLRMAVWGNYWQDVFRVQIGLGLRPDELATLKKADFSPGLKELTLSELDHLTLKEGSRTVKVPELVREIIERRLKKCAIVFPQIDIRFGKDHTRPWQNIKYYNGCYNEALQLAKRQTDIAIEIDCRTARRTCGSILLRSKLSIDEVAAILGDDPKTVAEHYASIASEEIDPSAAAI